jgi:adenylylsulfate kinase-like enzyme
MNKKIIRNKNKGILFWITGLSGSGKTTISKKIKKILYKKQVFALNLFLDY